MICFIKFAVMWHTNFDYLCVFHIATIFWEQIVSFGHCCRSLHLRQSVIGLLVFVFPLKTLLTNPSLLQKISDLEESYIRKEENKGIICAIAKIVLKNELESEKNLWLYF